MNILETATCCFNESTNFLASSFLLILEVKQIKNRPSHIAIGLGGLNNYLQILKYVV